MSVVAIEQGANVSFWRSTPPVAWSGLLQSLDLPEIKPSPAQRSKTSRLDVAVA